MEGKYTVKMRVYLFAAMLHPFSFAEKATIQIYALYLKPSTSSSYYLVYSSSGAVCVRTQNLTHDSCFLLCRALSLARFVVK